MLVEPGRGRVNLRTNNAYRAVGGVVGSVSDVTVSISITLDDELGEELDAAVAGSNRSALVAEAIREYLDRRAVAGRRRVARFSRG
jgi:hypothetical protein